MESKLNNCSDSKNWKTSFCIENLLGEKASSNSNEISSIREPNNINSLQEESESGIDGKNYYHIY